MKRYSFTNRAVLALGLSLLTGLPALADFRPANTTIEHHNFQVDGTTKLVGAVTMSGNQTTTGNQTVTGNETVGGTLGVTGASTLTGNTTVGGTLGVTGAVTLTVPLTSANIQTGSAKTELLTWHFAQNIATQTAADGVTYSATLFPGRAGTVTAISWGVKTPPTVGTDLLKVLKGTSAGNTMLSTATVDANGLVANTATAGTLTATGADLGLTAAQGIYVEYAAGTQTVDAIDLSVTIEFQPTDF